MSSLSVQILCLFKKHFTYLVTFGCVGRHCWMWAFCSCDELGLLFVVVCRFSLQWLLLLWSVGFRTQGLQQLLHVSSVIVGHGPSVPWHVESSWTRGQTDGPALQGRLPTTGPPGKTFSPFFKLNYLLVFLLGCMNSLYILDINPYHIHVCKYFPHSISYLPILQIVSFAVQELFSLM